MNRSDHKNIEGLVEGSLIEQALFIPMISVKMHYIKQLGNTKDETL